MSQELHENARVIAVALRTYMEGPGQAKANIIKRTLGYGQSSAAPAPASKLQWCRAHFTDGWAMLTDDDKDKVYASFKKAVCRRAGLC